MKHVIVVAFILTIVICLSPSLSRYIREPAQAQSAANAQPKDDQPPPGMYRVKLNDQTFTLPIGFQIELVAGPPMVDRPINANFDERGRLYVTDSSGSNEALTIQLQKKPHRIHRLEDTTGTGKFDRGALYADKMMFPEGALWYDGSLYVTAPPSIWKLTDTNGDGVVDERFEWMKCTLGGCGNDLHGPYLGPDGWIYWNKGASKEQKFERPGKKPFVAKGSRIFRAKVDGSDVESVMTGSGVDNPVGLVFTPGGERIYNVTFLQRPGGGKRDGLVHALYGGVYDKDYEGNSVFPRTAPSPMPVMTHLGVAAPSGMIRYQSDVFGKDYQDNLFCTCFNLQKVFRHVLEQDGATFKTRDIDFLISDSKDFHPTDVIEDADGSLLVIDTGGWYRFCCPSSQLAKPEVLGAIYRMRKVGAPRIDDPRGLKLNWKNMDATALAKLLADSRPAVRKRAMEALAKTGPKALDALAAFTGRDTPATARRDVVWTATRISGGEEIVRKALGDVDETVRQAALHSASLRRDQKSIPQLLKILQAGTAHNRRAAAKALGRMEDRSVIPALLNAMGTTSDRCLEHSLIYALIEIGDHEGTKVGLSYEHPSARRAALIALDQMEESRLEATAVAPALSAADPKLQEAAWWIASRHAEWGQTLSKFFQGRLTAKNLKDEERIDLVNHLAKMARSPSIQSLLAERLRDDTASREDRRLALNAISQARLGTTPAGWLSGIEQILNGNDSALIAEALVVTRKLPQQKKLPAGLTSSLARLALDDKLSAEIRLYSLAISPTKLTNTQFDLVRNEVKAERPVVTRALAAEILAQAPLTKEELLAVASILPEVGPMELQRILEGFAQSSDDEVGRQLLAALSKLPGRSALRNDQLKSSMAKFSPEVRQEAEKLYAALDAEAGKQAERLEKILVDLDKLGKGDINRGHLVFHNQKNACSSCHALGYLGGTVGPDLTRIGQIRTQRDLVEAIIFPNASIVRSYEPVQVVTKAGKVYNGILRRDEPQEIMLVLGANQEVVIPRTEIDEMQPSRVSIMPSALDQQLSMRDLADLVAFLQSRK